MGRPTRILMRNVKTSKSCIKKKKNKQTFNHTLYELLNKITEQQIGQITFTFPKEMFKLHSPSSFEKNISVYYWDYLDYANVCFSLNKPLKRFPLSPYSVSKADIALKFDNRIFKII